MGKRKNDWQDSQYVLRLFGESVSAARRSYRAYVARQLNISPNTVSMAVSRGQKIEDIKKIQKQILGI
jgi:DNA-binding CsgD family transcriptional regulator